MAKLQGAVYTTPCPVRPFKRQIGPDVVAKYARTLEELEEEELEVRPYRVVYVPSAPAQESFDAQAAKATDIDPKVEELFNALAEQWYVETMPLSSYIEKVLHPAYQRIIGLGRDVVPLIINELREMPHDWFWALRAVTGKDPIAPEDAGDLHKMAQTWLHWWEQEGRRWWEQGSR